MIVAAGLGGLAALQTRRIPMPPSPQVFQRSKRSRPGAAAVEIGGGVRMHCQEVSADLAIIRFLRVPPQGREPAPRTGDKRRARPPARKS
jgi:hypothetical protein